MSEKTVQGDIRQQLRDAVAHLEHVLPGQAPIRDFVHHNTLHGFQHLPFREALAEAYRITGAWGYMSRDDFRKAYTEGRVNREDLLDALDREPRLGAGESLFESDGEPLPRRELYVTALLHAFRPIGASQLTWEIEEQQALNRFQADVPDEPRQRLLASAGMPEGPAIMDLWRACLEVLGLEYDLAHPEELVELTPEQAEQRLTRLGDDQQATGARGLQQHMGQEASRKLQSLLNQVGSELTLRGLLLALTGVDLMDDMRPYISRHLASWLDQGLTAWHHRNRAAGFYSAWLKSVQRNVAWALEGLEEWRHHLESLPEEPLEAVMEELRRLGLPRERWPGYLERLALELPGWSGMYLWRSRRPGYDGQTHPVEMMDYLAVRLVMERVFAQRLAAPLWQIEPGIDMLHWYFRRNPAEFLVRHALFNERLPEYLASRAQRLATREGESLPAAERWQHLAELVWIWQRSPAADLGGQHSVFRSAWPLFRLAQHLGLSGAALRRLNRKGAKELLGYLRQLDDQTAGYLRLLAYERHYRQALFSALVQNYARGRWHHRDERPAVQLMTCMDDRTEGLRRYVEELDPEIETLGAAGYFNLTLDWTGLDDDKRLALCPVSQVPVNEIREQPRPDWEAVGKRHRRHQRLRRWLQNLLHQETRRDLLAATGLIAAAAPGTAVALAGKVFLPGRWDRLLARLRDRWEPPLPTRIRVDAPDPETQPTPEHPLEGFTREQQLQRVSAFLHRNGFTRDFAPLVVMMGHGSQSQNNPHLAAYGCGACSGRYSGPNGRSFAAIVNQPEVRRLLRQQGIEIPDDTWFVGAQHNTCDDRVSWYDTDLIPDPLRSRFEALRATVEQGGRRHAAERSRRFASAPLGLSPDAAWDHVAARLADFSQARPELGHACIALAVIGRRALSRGLFLDRRAFLISYDPTHDSSGELLEQVLLEVGPVGAGIALEYYFSTVDNERYGCGSKVTHNVTGLFGVMEGAASDLRTGLPKQMVEIHEPMRLLVAIEATTEVLTAIVERQPPLQQLILNEWILVASVDPSSGAIALFRPGGGFIAWQDSSQPLPEVERSEEWLRGREPLPPAYVHSANAGGKHD